MKLTQVISKWIAPAIVAVTLVGCASCNRIKPTPPLDLYANITADNIADQCKTPVEYHYVPPGLILDVPIQVLRFKDCLAQPDVLAMNFLGQNDEKTKAYIHLMMLLYLDSVKDTTGFAIQSELIRESRLTTVDGQPVTQEIWFFVYKISPLPVETPDTAKDTSL